MIRTTMRCCLLLVFLLTTAAAEKSIPTTHFADQAPVNAFILHMESNYHFKKSELIALFNHVNIRHTVTKQIKHPTERKSWGFYKSLFVNEQRIKRGIVFWNKYQDVLAKAEAIYGVPPSIIVATIGVETNYGQHTGEFPVMDALATLAFSNNARANFFKKELEQFLLLCREQHLNPLKVMGSYAGAIGQPQFMPSSYRKYAVNFSGNAHIDLSHNEVDVIGSIANYYKQNGWSQNAPVAIPASIANGRYQLTYTRPRPIAFSEFIVTGIIPDTHLRHYPHYKLLTLTDGFRTEYWLSFENFDVIKRYNYSDLYAMAVYQLSYYLNLRKYPTR